MVKYKKCKGTGKAKGLGCGNKMVIFKYGLCKQCYIDFLYNTPKGKEMLANNLKRAKKQIIVQKKRKHTELKKQIKTIAQYKKDLQTLVNKIVRLIDIDEPCISCGYDFKSGNRMRHSGHYFARGSHPHLAYNFHNIHIQCSICNTHLHGNIENYTEGLKQRYGNDYLINEIEVLKTYLVVKHTKEEYKLMIINARKIIKDIESGIDYTRNELNIKLYDGFGIDNKHFDNKKDYLF